MAIYRTKSEPSGVAKVSVSLPSLWQKVKQSASQGATGKKELLPGWGSILEK